MSHGWVADPRCQRGLRFTLILPEPAPAQADITATLVDCFPAAVTGFERWGSRCIDRLILPFRVEFRVGERPGIVTVLFRSCCPEPQRAQLRECLFTGIGAKYDW